MPMFTRKCSICGFVFETLAKTHDEPCSCEKCGAITFWQPGSPARVVHFKEGWYDNITDHPIYVTSMQQLHDECKKHGVRSEYAEDSPRHRFSRGRWI